MRARRDAANKYYAELWVAVSEARRAVSAARALHPPQAARDLLGSRHLYEMLKWAVEERFGRGALDYGR